MTIDERLEALAMRLEVLTRVHEDFKKRTKADSKRCYASMRISKRDSKRCYASTGISKRK